MAKPPNTTSFLVCYVPFVPGVKLCSLLSVVVGQAELESRSVNVRNRDDVGSKARSADIVSLDTIGEQLVKLKATRSLHNKLS